MVWTHAGEIKWTCWTEDVDGGAARWEVKKTLEKINGCSQRGHEDGCWNNGGGNT